MHENMIGGGALTNWLAIVGVISLMYWAWRIIAAIQHRGSGREKTPGAPAAPAPAAALPGPPAEDIAVIAAAVHMTMGVHRIVHLETINPGQSWAAEGRWMQQTSHNHG